MFKRLATIFVSLWMIWMLNPEPIMVCVPNPSNDGKLVCLPFVKVGICPDNDTSKQQEIYLPKAIVDGLQLDKNPNI